VKFYRYLAAPLAATPARKGKEERLNLEQLTWHRGNDEWEMNKHQLRSGITYDAHGSARAAQEICERKPFHALDEAASMGCVTVPVADSIHYARETGTCTLGTLMILLFLRAQSSSFRNLVYFGGHKET
jgi:hypothetical protein